MKRFYFSRLIIPILLLLGISNGASAQTTYNYIAGTVQYYTVPAGVTQVGFDVIGACGGRDYNGNYSTNSKGARVTGNLNVTPGQVLYLVVGGKGTDGVSCCTYGAGTGGYNGGGLGYYYYSGGGGGASDIRFTAPTGTSGTSVLPYTISSTNRVVVAGGGGGAGYNCGGSDQQTGGEGGYPTGGLGKYCGSTSYGTCQNASGGGQTSGGVNTCGGSNGSAGVGGQSYTGLWGGGGGGGYYGGAGGYYGGGGGGSSYTGTQATGVAHSNGFNLVSSSTSGHGRIIIYGPTLTASPTSMAFGGVTVGARSIPPKFTTITGIYMGAGPLTATSSCSNFEVSSDGVSWGSTATFTYTPPTILPTNFYVRFVPSAATSYSCNLTITGGGAVPVVIPMTGTGTTACTGTPAAGLAQINGASSATGGAYTQFTLSLAGSSSAGGLTYKWQSAPTAGGPWTDIPGAVLSTFTFTGISATTFYRATVTCPTGGSATTLAPATATLSSVAASSCTPSCYQQASLGSMCGFGFYVATVGQAFTINGAGGTQLNDGTSCGIAFYRDQTAVTSMTCTMAPGGSYGTIMGGITSNITSAQIWIDFNNDGSFNNSTETVGGLGNFSNARASFNTVIPAGTPYGVYRLRAQVDYSSNQAPGANANYPCYPLQNPCPQNASTSVYYAETRDYFITIAPPPCSGTPAPVGITDASANTSCAPFSPALFLVGAQAGAGLVYQWQQSPDGTLGSFFPLPGATAAVYTPSITAVGTTYYNVKVTCANGGGNATTNMQSITYNAPPSSITGTTNVCTGLTRSLSSFPSGGVWTTSSGTTVTVGSSTGVITGVAAGVDNVTYTLSTGCNAITPITVNTNPAPITGTLAVCRTLTTALAESMTGGTWSAFPTSVATVTTGGVATGVANGNANISYTLPTGCFTVSTLTVNPLPSQYIVSYTGFPGYCAGNPSTANITLSGSTAGIQYQLLLGGSPVGLPVTGTGGTLSFGIQTTPGNYTVSALNTVTGCVAQMIGSVTVVIYPTPSAQTVVGGGSFCAGGAGVNICLGGSEGGVNYQLYLGSTPVSGALVTGTGLAVCFGLQTAPGIYTVVATNGFGCTRTMTGTATITLDPPPAAHNVTGGGSYCAGGLGQPVNLDFSNIGISYVLLQDGTPIITLAGTGAALHFGYQTIPATYTVVATNTSTGCVNTMNFSAVVSVDALPNDAYIVSGGGTYCAGGTGVLISTDGSDPGVDYQLFNGTSLVGSIVPGYGVGLNMGLQTVSGVYTVIATDATTGCSSTLTGSASVGINPLPFIYSMTGGGNFCNGATGVHVGLSSSTTGISYQLFINGTNDVIVVGNGSALDFGVFTTPGIYTVVATNTVTGCTSNMAGIATIGVNPLPAIFNVTGTGAYCAGGAGRAVGIDFSSTGVSYQLLRNGVNVGSPVAGTGAAISFGLQTIVGTYTVVATNNATGCTENMAGSAVITTNPLPINHLVTGGGSYCAGGAGVVVSLNGSETGINYQLNLGFSTVGSHVAGTGSIITFGPQTVAGTYTVLATDALTGCTKNMVGGAAVNVNPLPSVFNVTGGGIYCSGTSGLHVGLSGSASGIKYQLMRDGVATGTPVSGSGFSLDFGLQINTGTYTVVATNAATLCTNNMSGSTVIATNILPVVYNVTGGGNYCVGGAGFNVILDGSDPGVSYQLYLGTTMVGTPITGTGSALDFGVQTAAGNYTAIATDMTTGCTVNMSGVANITINPLPAAYTVLGGGNYCDGGTGVHVFLNVSSNGATYQLYNGSSAVGGPIPGSGSSLDFGLQTVSGIYSVTAMTTSTGCTNNMSGTATVNINPLPTSHMVTGGGAYCTGGTGVAVGLDASESGIKYQLMYGGSPVGAPVSGSSTGGAISFGLQTSVGGYTVVATNAATTCSSPMNGMANVSVQALPTAYAMSGGGNYCATGIGVHVNLSGSDAGINYQLYHAGSPLGVYLEGTGGALDLGLQTDPGTYTVIATNATTGCVKSMSGTSVVNVIPVVIPSVNITPSLPGVICTGQSVTYNASPINGGTSPTYQWFVNGVSVGVGSTYSYAPLDGDVVTSQINSNAECAIPTIGSNSTTATVSNMQMPSATVTANPGTLVCTGALTTFTAATMYGGTAPTYTWLKNGVSAGTGTTYSYVPSNGDIITFMLGSNFNCRLADHVFSAPVAITVQNPILPTVTVTANPGASISAGQAVTFTATSNNAGPNATYQWVINSTPVAGATMSTFTSSSLSDMDSVSCQVTGVCAMVGFNAIIMTVSTTGVTQVTSAGSDVKLIPNPNKGEFSIRGTVAASLNNEVSIEVVNMLGQVVYTGKAETKNGAINERIKLNSGLANGMYLLNLRSGSEHTVFHFVIEQ